LYSFLKREKDGCILIWIHVAMETQLRVLESVLSASDETFRKLKGCRRSTTAVKRLCRDIGVCLGELCHWTGMPEPSELVEAVQQHIQHYQRLLADSEALIGKSPLGGSPGHAYADTDAESLEQALAHVLAQLVSALTGGALSALQSGHLAYEHSLVLTTLRWLLELRPGELDAQQLCQGIAIYLADGTDSLADIRTITEAEVLRVCGAVVRRTPDGAGIELAYPRDQSSTHTSTHTPETRYEIAIACLRILNFPEFANAPAEYRLEQVRVAKRDAAHPFYRYAALAWIEVAPDEEDDDDEDDDDDDDATLVQELTHEARRLFNSPRNLMPWLLEVGRQSFAAAYPLPPAKIFVSLATLCAKSRPPPEDIAACLGLAHVCIALLGDDLDDDTRSGRVARLVYCALAGPALLIASVLDLSWEAARKNFRLRPCLDTARRLCMLELAEDGPPRSIYGASPPSVVAALMAYAARSGPGDAEAFVSLFDAESLADPVFLELFRDPAFPYAAADDDGNAPTRQQEQFLDALCNSMLDKLCRIGVADAWHSVWHKAVEYGLPCIQPTTRRRVPVRDDIFPGCMLYVVVEKCIHGICYLMQDPRWNSNLPLEEGLDEEDRGRTLLHQAVEDGAAEVVRFLLENGGADVSVSDASGRTPVHLCTSTEILELLHDRGADLRQTDNDGRLLWHYAAANNDFELLQMLLKLDPDTDWVLKQTTKQGRTPLAEAFAYVQELNGLPSVPSREHTPLLWDKMQSIRLILDSIESTKIDPAYLCSDIPVVCLAAVWGDTSLVRRLRRLFGQLEVAAPDGCGPLHFLNFAASAELVRELLVVPGVAELPVLNGRGLSPAETIFLAFTPSIDEPDDNAHPSNNAELNWSAYKELLTEAVCESRDEQGRTLWERFCRNVIVRYAYTKGSSCVGDAMVTAVRALSEKRVIQQYESEADVCAFEELAKLLWHETSLDYIPRWLVDVYSQLLRVTIKVQRLRDAPQLFLRGSESLDGYHVAAFDRLLVELVAMGVDSGRVVRSESRADRTV